MAKKRPQPVHVKNQSSNIIVLSAREIDKKIRKIQPPASRLHTNKTKYSRKSKFPFKED